MNQNAPAAVALGAALAAIAGFAFWSLAGRDRLAPLRTPPPASAPAAAEAPPAKAPAGSGEPTFGAPVATVLVEPEHEDPSRAGVQAAARERFAFTGRVREAGGAPVAAADVLLTFKLGDAELFVLGETVTDAEGTYTLESPTPLELDPARRALGLLVAKASAQGYRPSTVEARLATDASAQELDFVLATGGRLTGRVLDARGSPVDGAEVALVVAGSRPGRDELTLAQTTESDAEGLFELGFVSAGQVAVHVRASGLGSAWVDETPLSAGSDADLGDITLAGTGLLGGRVTYPDGTPARALELWAIPGDLAGRVHALALARRGVLERERGVGLTLDRDRTDEDGRFRFSGLAEGGYTIVTEHKESTLAPSGAVHATGTEDVSLVLGARRLFVIVRAQDDRPLPGATVSVTPLVEDERGVHVAGPARRAVARGAEAGCDFEVPAGSPLAVRVTAPGCHPVDARVELADGERERRHTVVLYPSSSSGTLRLDVRDERGNAFAGLRVWVLSESTGLPLPGFGGVAPEENGSVGPLPPGRYGLAVWPGAATPGDDLGTAFPVETTEPVEVLPNAETFVPLVARSGGRVRLSLTVPRESELASEPDEGSYGSLTLRRRAARRLREHGAQATFVAEDGRTTLVHFETEGGLELLLLPGTAGLVHDLFEPGRYAVRVEAPGFVPASETVLIEPGVVSEVGLELVPAPE